MFTLRELDGLIRQESFQEAIFYASPELYAELNKYLNGDLDGKEAEKMIGTVYKYMQRIHFRCTPFGAFAYCSIGEYSDVTRTNESAAIKKHYRYDGKFLYDYVFYLLENSDSELIETLNICTNQTLILIQTFYHVSVQRENGLIIDIKLPRTELLDYIVNYCKKISSCEALIADCLKIFDIEHIALVSYIRKLILNGILISEIQIGSTGEDNLNKLYRCLNNLNPPFLYDLRSTLSVLNGESNFENKYNAITSLLEKLRSGGVKVTVKMFLQIDAYSEERMQLEESIKYDISEWFELLTHICSPLGNPLHDFINRFNSRYENMSVPLLSVMNEQIGIGYQRASMNSSDFIKNLFTIKVKPNKLSKNYSYTLSELEQVVLNKLIANGHLSPKNINLTRADFPYDSCFEEKDNSASYSCMYRIDGYNERGPIISNVNFSGPSASCLITRFADSVVEINDILKEISEREQEIEGNKILAEISHLSSPHAANVQIRPSFREFEIPYLTYNDAVKTNIVELEDLSVRVLNGKVYLYSKKYDKEICPCFSSAFNHNNNTTALYQFLGDIQLQNSARRLSVNMLSLLSLIKHIPRIWYKNIVVCPEIWQIDNFWTGMRADESCDKFRKLHNTLKMPSYLEFYQGDNYIILDIKSDISMKEFFKLSKNQAVVILQECLALSDDFMHYNSTIEIVQPFFPIDR